MTDQPRRASVRWAARVPPALIRRLYETDAAGIRDEEMADEVGCALYARCRSILAATDAQNGRIVCPGCRALIVRAERAGTLECPACGWAMAWEAYRNTYKGQRLMTGGAGPAFEGYIRAFDAAQSYRDKVLAIDRLVHAVHVDAQGRPSAPAARNVIEGTVREVLDLLDGLAYGDASQAELAETAAQYRRAVARGEGRGHLKRRGAARPQREQGKE